MKGLRFDTPCWQPYRTLDRQKEEVDICKVRRRIEDRLRKDKEAVIQVAKLLKIKAD